MHWTDEHSWEILAQDTTALYHSTKNLEETTGPTVQQNKKPPQVSEEIHPYAEQTLSRIDHGGFKALEGDALYPYPTLESPARETRDFMREPTKESALVNQQKGVVVSHCESSDQRANDRSNTKTGHTSPKNYNDHTVPSKGSRNDITSQ
ncbi:hypothetical protein BDV24DRAFT_170626 [Aspergillus arachidicola]|uniref:Uncharacterized protein n=1 Tax=Aspergillus arachidicola TaxID=656916 RepID=A0A5N6XLD3_9EURO|nr:hypothetical protein BDV24DRAFT_170626 [Aspergillus arachidicola]